MKVLYATQATGNGHLVRALELIPILKSLVDLDIFISGSQGQIQLPYKIDYSKYGLSFVPGEKGSISYFRTARSLKLGKLISDIKSCNVRDYDLVINDFEPITAWACRIKGVSCISMSHQAAFRSPRTPRPEKVNKTQEFILKHYAPSRAYCGFHFESYDKNIRTPIIARDIRHLRTREERQVSVYLPAYSGLYLSGFFSQLPEFEWQVFSPAVQSEKVIENVTFCPISREGWLNAFSRSCALLIGAGFEGPAEALFHGKKLMVIPMKNQYEQYCNAEALARMGVRVSYGIEDGFERALKQWLYCDRAIQREYPVQGEALIRDILECA